MNRDQKAQAIEEIAADIEAAEAIFAVDYRGISVPQAAELRSKLRDADASFRVVKNRLTKIAAEKAGEDRLDELLEGPTALTFVRGDTAQAAKTISTFTKENDVLVFKGGFMDSLALDEEKFKSIARLPSRDVLNGQLAGVVASPLTGLVRGLGSMIQGLALAVGPDRRERVGYRRGTKRRGRGSCRGGGSSSSQAAGEEPTPAPPTDDEDEGHADVPAEEPPTESGAEAEPPAEEPSQAEGDDKETSDSADDD